VLSNSKGKWRIRIAFLLLFVAFAVGAWFVGDLGKLRQDISARESGQAVQGITDVGQIEEVFKKYPSSKFLQVMAMATRAADETTAAAEKLSKEVAPGVASGEFNFGAASRADLESLRRDIKTAQANAAAFMPRFAELFKREREKVKAEALWHLKAETAAAMLDNIDKRHADMTALLPRLLAARGDFYRAYENFVALLIGEFGAYKVVNGQLIFPNQRAVERYNVAANAMRSASNRVAGLEAERKALVKSGQDKWVQFVKGAW
jgi:hypothetical protein